MQIVDNGKENSLFSSPIFILLYDQITSYYLDNLGNILPTSKCTKTIARRILQSGKPL